MKEQFDHSKFVRSLKKALKQSNRSEQQKYSQMKDKIKDKSSNTIQKEWNEKLTNEPAGRSIEQCQPKRKISEVEKLK